MSAFRDLAESKRLNRNELAKLKIIEAMLNDGVIQRKMLKEKIFSEKSQKVHIFISKMKMTI